MTELQHLMDELELSRLERDEARDRALALRARVIRLEQGQHGSDRLVEQLRFENSMLTQANEELAAESRGLRSDLMSAIARSEQARDRGLLNRRLDIAAEIDSLKRVQSKENL